MSPVNTKSSKIVDFPSKINETDLYVLNNTTFHADIKVQGEETFTEVFQLFENEAKCSDVLDKYCVVKFKKVVENSENVDDIYIGKTQYINLSKLVNRGDVKFQLIFEPEESGELKMGKVTVSLNVKESNSKPTTNKRYK